MNFEVLLQLAGPVGVGVGVYAAIRADLARLTAVATNAAAMASKAHDRLDDLYRVKR